jgi:hypothetical protein
MTTDVHEGPLEAAPAITTPVKKTWREQRWERRRRRIWLEEALAWILVPVIVLGGYYLVDSGLNALGTSPAAIIAGISMIASGL